MLLPKNYFLEFVLCICCQTNVSVKTSDRFQIVFLRKDNFIQIGQPKNIFYVLNISVAKYKKPSFYSMVLKSAEHIVYFSDFLAWLLIWSSIMSAKTKMFSNEKQVFNWICLQKLIEFKTHSNSGFTIVYLLTIGRCVGLKHLKQLCKIFY